MVIVISPLLERLVYPPMVATQSIPKIALAPLFIVWFGFGVAPKVAVAFLIAFFPIVIDTIVGLRSIDPAMIQLARSMGAPPHRIFRKLRLPHALPAIFGGLKVASSLAVVGALTGEFVGSDKGLGYLLVQASGNLNTALLFATLVVLSALAMALFYLVEMLERIAIPWHASQRTHPALTDNRNQGDPNMLKRRDRFLAHACAIAVAAGIALGAFPAAAAEKVSLRLDWVNSGYHAIWYYGIDKGIFEKAGIDLEVLEGKGSAVTAQTVGNDSVMFGTADTAAVMGLIAQGMPIKIVRRLSAAERARHHLPGEQGLEEICGHGLGEDRFLGRAAPRRRSCRR